MGKVALGLGLVVMALGFVLVLMVGAGQSREATLGNECSSGAAAVKVNGVPVGNVAEYGGKQLENAAIIMSVADELGMGLHGQRLGVAAAMGETSLINVDYGDKAGPDSRGLFQQRANGAWGSLSDRMTPAIAARNFLQALKRVDGWQTLSPTTAIHRTQRNADPNHYARYWPAAVQVVDTLSGNVTVTPVGEEAGTSPCGEEAPRAATAPGPEGWASPIHGSRVLTNSKFGPRFHPVLRMNKLHEGQDMAAPDGTPIYAAADGVVTVAGFPWEVGEIRIDHGGGLQTVYLHMWQAGILVKPGQQVKAGEQIGKVGSSGRSTGPHLHFEFRINGKPVEPLAQMAARGVTSY